MWPIKERIIGNRHSRRDHQCHGGRTRKRHPLGAISGTVGGAVNAGSQGYDWKDGARKGALSGAVSGGLFHQAGSIAQENGWANTSSWTEGRLQKVGLHAGAGGAASVLTGGEFWNGALPAGFAEATGPYVEKLPGGTWGQAGGAAASGAAASWLSGGDAEEGALRGLSGYLFNRLMHPAEKQAVNKLTAEGGDRPRLEAVACAEVACWSGSDLGVTSRHVKEQVDGVVGAMRSDEYRSTLAQLKRAAPGAFEYTWGDGVRDDWQDNNITTRMTGVAQWLGGGLQAAALR
jgi:hypothetical protein